MIISHNNPRLKPLNQDDFKMKIIEDLGLIYPKSRSNYKTRYGIFVCNDCKNTLKSSISEIKKNKQEVCRHCSNITHGLRSHKLYSAWSKQKHRCMSKSNKHYNDYGGRGIVMHILFLDFKTWLSYVENLPNAYKKNYTIDRVNNDANYEPMNLRWASKTTQARNTRILNKNNTSGYRGVYYDKIHSVWKARVSIHGKMIFIKSSSCRIECAKAYDKYIDDNNLEHTKNFS